MSINHPVEFGEQGRELPQNQRTSQGVTQKEAKAGPQARALYTSTITDNDRMKPPTAPKSAGDRIHRKMGPGIAKACKRV